MSDPLEIPVSLPADYVPTPPQGLTDREADRRKPNRTKADRGRPVWQIVFSHLFTLFNLLNIALAVCLALVGSWRNMLFMGVVVSNTLIGTVQELRARRTIRRLTLLNQPRCRVLRDGRERVVEPDELAEGDLVLLGAGDQVVADVVVRDGSGAVDESLLTGEPDPEPKHPGDLIMSGSYVTEGSLTAQLIYVGDDSYAARLTRSARRISRPRSALMTELNRLIRFVSIALVPLGLLLFLKQHLVLELPLQDAVPATVAAMIGMIPEGLMLLTSVAMAAGVVKLGRCHTLVQELYGIETLARADVLCLDKTGTITTGKMQLERLDPLGGDGEALRSALSRFLGAMEERSSTLDALRAFVPPGSDRACAHIPFSSARKLSAVSFPDGETLVLGAPGFVPSAVDDPAMDAVVAAAAEDGCRVLALVRCRGVIAEDRLPPAERTLGLCIISDEVRPSAGDTLRYFREQGVAIRVISGDDARTVAAIGRRVGLEGEHMDAAGLSDEALVKAAEHVTIFGRVNPAQKKLLVETWKAQGHSVAMTGDGVNDIPALKAADCSIAMAGGSDAAKHAAQLTLMNADFAAMPLVVSEGRRVIGNITRTSALFLVKTLYSFALSLLLLFLPTAYPFQPIQLTLVSTLTIGMPGFFLALEPNHARVQGSFLQAVLLRAIPGAAAVTVCAVASMLCRYLGWTEGACTTLATLSAGMVGLMMLMTVCLPLTKVRAAVLAAMTGLFVLAVLTLGRVFFLVTLTPVQTAALALLTALGALVMALATRLIRMKRARKASKAAAGA